VYENPDMSISLHCEKDKFITGPDPRNYNKKSELLW